MCGFMAERLAQDTRRAGQEKRREPDLASRWEAPAKRDPEARAEGNLEPVLESGQVPDQSPVSE
jgi:hypothetical protein